MMTPSSNGGLRRMLARLVLFAIFPAAMVWGQAVPKMRNRKLTSLTNAEVEEYLKRNDTIIIPVGPIEMHGLMPLETEYVQPLGWAIKMAEKADALVFPHFAYDYPGGTTTGRGTFYLSMTDTSQWLMKICDSLVRQGFKRFFFVSGHGPAENTIYPVVRTLYEKYGVPAMSTGSIASAARAKVAEAGGKTDKTFYGLYQIAGQLEDIPLGVVLEGYVPQAPPASGGRGRGGRGGGGAYETYPGTDALSMGIGNLYTDPSQHSWSPDQPLTEALRAQYAKEGVAQVEAVVAAMDFGPALRAMNSQIKTYKEVILPKYGDLVNFK
jgi:creatinine amidohydrolase